MYTLISGVITLINSSQIKKCKFVPRDNKLGMFTKIISIIDDILRPSELLMTKLNERND